MGYVLPEGLALRQGDILAQVRTFELEYFDGDIPVGKVREYEFAVVVTQACDLEQDFKARFPGEASIAADKLLFSIMACGAYRAGPLKAGTHRPGASKIDSKVWNMEEQNRDPRYQNLGYVPMQEASLVADFKDFFFVSCDYIYRRLQERGTRRVAALTSPYQEQVLQRFANYISRVGLPCDFHRFSNIFPPRWEDPVV